MVVESTHPAIPVNVITGFLGVGKTTALQHLLTHHAENERWGVLVNEFGEIGIDGSLLDAQGAVVEEVAGGCLCCVAAPAFTTGLNRLIRQHRPDRILIEPSGLGHPAQILSTLRGPLYAGVLELRATLCLMDARHLQSPRHLAHPNFQDQIHLADVLIGNKSDCYTQADLDAFEQFVLGLTPAKQRVATCEFGRVNPSWLDSRSGAGYRAAFPEAHAFLIEQTPEHNDSLAADPWLMIEGHADGYYRVGWLVDWPGKIDATQLRQLLDDFPVERRKCLFPSADGWQVLNDADQKPVSSPSDGLTRIELIDSRPIESMSIDGALRSLAGIDPRMFAS